MIYADFVNNGDQNEIRISFTISLVKDLLTYIIK